MVRRRLLARLACVSLLFMLLGATPLADVAAVGPPTTSGPAIDIQGNVRVIDGDTIEVLINGARVGVGLIGIDAPEGNTQCGRMATDQLQALVQGGVRLEGDPAFPDTVDAHDRKLYHVFTADHRLIGQALVRAGVARADGQGAYGQQLAAAQAQARGAGEGCVWSGDPNVMASSLGPATTTATPSSVQPMASTTLPVGFVQEVVAAGLDNPTAFAFLPDGRILVAQKAGLIRLYKNGVLQATPFVDLRDHVNNYWDHGLRGLAVDPNFAQNGYVYLLYTFENNASDFSGIKTQRVTRITAAGDTASPKSEVTILGTAAGKSCNDFPVGTDCMPADSASHEGGNIKFASDSTLFVSTGDASRFSVVDTNALRAQNLDSLAGKLLHITATGAGVPGNPFWTGDANANRSKVWDYGLRNPFRFNLRPGSGVPYIGDVGWNTWEEINVGVAGANFGWPCYEGNGQQPGYAPLAECQALYAQGTSAVSAPLTAYHHDTSSSVMGGFFYTGTAYPAEYQGAYFYADEVTGVIRTLRVNDANALTSGPTGFATGVGNLVDLELGADQNLYYLAIDAGELRRIRYAGSGVVNCLSGEYLSAYYANATLSGTPAFQRCESAINDDWGTGGPGNGLGNDNYSVRWTGSPTFVAGQYTFTVKADDGVRLWIDGTLLIDQWKDQPATQYQATLQLTSGAHQLKLEYYEHTGNAVAHLSWQAISINHAPVVTISAPKSSLRYKVGDVISYSGSATDQEDGRIASKSLSWSILLHHCPLGLCHTHPFLTSSGASGSFTIPDHGTDTYFEIVLSATDSDGQIGTSSVVIQPQTVSLTLDSSPAGLQVVIGGVSYTAPAMVAATVGSSNSINVPSPQSVCGVPYDFASWSDGGARSHNVVAGTSSATYVAKFTPRTNQSNPAAPVLPISGANYFCQTGHNLSGGFRTYWSGNGGLAVFGYPRTDEFPEQNGAGQTYTVQYFERQRFEYHSENAGTPYNVLLGLLGVADAKYRGLTGTAPFQPLQPTSDANCTFYSQTGHRLCNGFRTYWQTHGLDFGDPGYSYRESLALFGYPISEEFTDPTTGYTVQYFERARFEYHPEFAGTPYEVELGLLGNVVLQQRGWLP